jgi:UDP-N-acetylmuramate dehydrogenase
MNMQNNHSLKHINAFKLDIKAKYYLSINNKAELSSLFTQPLLKENNFYILGQGFNTLFKEDYNGVVININIKGIRKALENERYVELEIGAGEDWIEMVEYAIDNNYCGIENMNLIPGSVGSAPVQNIAAYGQNLEDVFVSLEAFDIAGLKFKKFNKAECKFAYRSSFFKTEGKNKYIITSVRIRLFKKGAVDTSYHSRYGSLVDELEKFAKPPFTIKDAGEAVKRIRLRKFPDWTKLGTAGSFFLNPVITKKQLAQLQKLHPNIQFYPVDKLTYPTPNDPLFDHDNHVKIPAGWLLEELGWRGKRIGDVGTSPEQSLVVINYGKATAEEVLTFTHKMKVDFMNAYNINLEPEVNII